MADIRSFERVAPPLLWYGGLRPRGTGRPIDPLLGVSTAYRWFVSLYTRVHGTWYTGFPGFLSVCLFCHKSGHQFHPSICGQIRFCHKTCQTGSMVLYGTLTVVWYQDNDFCSCVLNKLISARVEPKTFFKLPDSTCWHSNAQVRICTVIRITPQSQQGDAY